MRDCKAVLLVIWQLYIEIRKLGFKNIAGWSSLAARVAHNHEVVGSNPTPATSYPETRSAKRTA